MKIDKLLENASTFYIVAEYSFGGDLSSFIMNAKYMNEQNV